jgi:pyrroloquinoline quinone biosynthesis protein B
MRHSPIEGIVLTNGDLDHVLGLFCLRESYPIAVYSTRSVQEGFARDNPMFRTLQRFQGQVNWSLIGLDTPFELTTRSGERSGLLLSGWAVPGKLPLHLERTRSPSPEDNLGVEIREIKTGSVLVYLPAVGLVREREREAAASATCLFFDGTFWSSDELRRIDPNAPRAEAMAHVPIGGPEGSLVQLKGPVRGRRYFIHENNSNPVLREDSGERAAVEKAGWEVAWDGMELTL